RFKETSDLVKLAAHHNALLIKSNRTEFMDAKKFLQDELLQKIGIELIIPVLLQEQVIGFLCLGKKSSGAQYSEDDLDLLIPMAEEGFLALEHLRLQENAILERAEREKLEELNRLKSEFVSHVSHELRTPLTSIHWSVENLLDGIPEKPSPKLQEYLSGIHDSSQHLRQMIENLLDITKIEAGKIEIYTERVDISEEIQKTLFTLKPLAEKKNIHLEVVAEESLRAEADRDWLQAILTNLLDNAIKYSPERKSVQVKAKLFEEKENTIAISVVDEGPGIPREKQKAIFERFERIKQEKAVREKGLGLGLHIVKKLVELQRGQIWVESEENKGSTFTFTLPRG
ncbi:MAG: HAMP domain-containing sensor histidine kinase, partial [bacterium]